MSDAAAVAQRRRLLFGSVIAIALTAASAVVFSARWWWLGELAASFRWHLGWVCVLCAALLFSLRVRKTACFALAFACLHVGPEVALSFPSQRPSTRARGLNIVAANLLWPNKHIADVIEVLRAADPDVIAFEELSPTSLALLEGALASWPVRAVSPPRESWQEGTWGIGVFSKLPLQQMRLVPIGDSYAPMIEAQIELGGRTLTLRVVHLPRPGRLHHLVRRASALEALENNVSWDAHCVLVGDLNTTSTSPAFDDLLERTHLRDSRRGFGRQPTWTLHKLVLPLSIAIDHVLVGEGVGIEERETLTLPGSDHRAVRARIELR